MTMLDAEREAQWIRRDEPGKMPVYQRSCSGGYYLARVMDPSGIRRLEKRWALYWCGRRVWELQAMSHRRAAIDQAERWLIEHDVVR